LRRVSFDFNNYLGVAGGNGSGARIHWLEISIRANWRAIKPTKAFIESNRTGKKYPLMIDVVGYPKELAGKELPAGAWFMSRTRFSENPEGLRREELLHEFDGFRLVLENPNFEREFTRDELVRVLNRHWQIFSPPAPARVRF
jgi:hypothetical protein